MIKRGLLSCAIAAAVASAACSSTGSVNQLEIRDVSTAYFDEGVVDGQNKIVPSLRFTLHNKSGESVSSVQLNVQFMQRTADGPSDERLMQVIDSGGLPPQQSTQPIVARAKFGYTGQQPRAEMLRNSSFVDMKARVFGKAGSEQWVQLGEFTIERKIITQ